MFWKRKPKVGLLPKILGGLLCAVVVVASAVGGSALAMKIADSEMPFMQKVRDSRLNQLQMNLVKMILTLKQLSR